MTTNRTMMLDRLNFSRENIASELRKANKEKRATLTFLSNERIDRILQDLQNDPSFDIWFTWKTNITPVTYSYETPSYGKRFGRFVPRYRYEYTLMQK